MTSICWSNISVIGMTILGIYIGFVFTYLYLVKNELLEEE
jgi:hypothetical protein